MNTNHTNGDTILDRIIRQKEQEVVLAKQQVSEEALRSSAYFSRTCFSLKRFLLDAHKTGIIAEFKRQSPSKGVINGDADVVEVTKAYAAHGASCLSVLTDAHFFGGSNADLQQARVNELPILRKDFIIDDYQILEAKSIGADVILLIAACLSPQRVEALANFAQSLGMEVLLEIHNEQELQHICAATDMVGVNNRDLKTFTVDINRSIELSQQIPGGKIKIAESGIHDVETINIFKSAGFRGFLIGEQFMKQPNPAIAFANFVQQLNKSSV